MRAFPGGLRNGQTAFADETAGSTFDNIEVVDASLNSKLEITRVGSQAGDNGLLTVFAGFRNKTAHELNLDVETVYKDSAGTALNNASWIPMTLEAHEEKGYRSASISQQAADFIIRVRVTPPAKKSGSASP